MIIKILIKSFFLFLLFFNLFAKANDISSMANISEAAGSSAQAAADQLAADANKVAENIFGANGSTIYYSWTNGSGKSCFSSKNGWTNECS